MAELLNSNKNNSKMHKSVGCIPEMNNSDHNLFSDVKTPLKDNICKKENRRFHWFDAAIVLVSLFTFLADNLTDILVGVQYIRNRDYIWASITLSLVFFPAMVIQIFSLRWYRMDGKHYKFSVVMVHLLHLQPLERYVQTLIAGYHAYQTQEEDDVNDYYHRQNDVCMLRLFEAFLESAPQLTLQLYIMLYTQDANWLTVSAAAVSLVSLGWAVAAYSNALRQAHIDSYRIHWPGLLLQTLWHIGVVSARVLAIVGFSAVYQAWIFLFLGIHWGIMTIWIITQRTDFCPTFCEEGCFNAVVGVIYIFCYFNLKEGQTRWRVLAYYVIAFCENSLLVALWFPWNATTVQWKHIVIIGTIYGSFALGIVCMVVYYRFCHPSGAIYCGIKTTGSYSPPNTDFCHGTDPHIQLPYPPKYTSTAQLPRRTLKPTQSNVEINCREVDLLATPMSPAYLRQKDSSWYMHYTLDSSGAFDGSLTSTPVHRNTAQDLDSDNAISVSDVEEPSQKRTKRPPIKALRRLVLEENAVDSSA